MIQAQALVDYENLRSARVTIFIDITHPNRTFDVLDAHSGAIERLANLFGARILFADHRKLEPESIVDNDAADAWLLLVAEGQNRSMTSRKNPHRINVETQVDWERHAFKELLRQVCESSRILEDVTSCYSRYASCDESYRPSLS